MEWKSPPVRGAKRLVRRLTGPFLGGVVGAIVGVLLVRFTVPFLDDLLGSGRKVPAVVALFCLPLAWLIAVGFHEFGHVAGGWLIAFINSFDELTMSVFVASPSTATLPVKMYNHIVHTIDPLLASISTVLIVLTLVLMLALDRLYGLDRILAGGTRGRVLVDPRA